MKSNSYWNTIKRFGCTSSLALALVTAPLALPRFDTGSAHAGLLSEANAAEGGGKGSMGGKKGGGQKKGSSGGQVQRGSANKSISDILAGEEEDSDRPAWSRGNKELNPHRGTGSAGSTTKKGSDYGDIWVILRDDSGNPILDTNGNVQPCLDTACTKVVQLTADGELPEEYASQVIAVEFGRLNIARSPSKVLDHALVEALAKLDGGVLGGTVTLDPSGRLVVDGSAIDSPLENLALYKALLTAPVVDGKVVLSVKTTVEGEGDVTYTFSVPESERLDLAASAIAAASDKTDALNIDEIVNISKFLGVDDELANLVSNYTYDRTATYGDAKVWVLVQTSAGVYTATEVKLIDKVAFTDVAKIDGDDNGIDRFAQAADDSVQVLEYVHDNAIDQ